MKMKTGPKVLLLAILFVGLGYWAGRGFPRTWQALAPWGAGAPWNAPTSAAPAPAGTVSDMEALQDRVSDLEIAVAELKNAQATTAAPETAAPEAAVPPATGAPTETAVPPVSVPEGSL